jgi:hypothetical protein
VPAWHEGRRELPILFAGSAASAAAGWGLIVAARPENEPAVRMAVLGAVVELAAEQMLGMIAETLQDGKTGKRLRLAKLLSAGGVSGPASSPGAAASRRSPPERLLARSAFTRFGLFETGMASARDPKYTVEPQRSRREAQRAAAPSEV